MLGRYQVYRLLGLWSPGGVNAMVIEYCPCSCSARPGTSLAAIRFPVDTGIALARAPTCREACSRAPIGGQGGVCAAGEVGWVGLWRAQSGTWHARSKSVAGSSSAKVRGNVIGVSIKDGCSVDGPNDIKHCERATMHVSAGDGTCRLVGTHRLSL
jgi:hypothetical protein